MPSDTDNDFHVKEIQDMVNVIQRMIKDGKQINIKSMRLYVRRRAKIYKKIISASRNFLEKRRKKTSIIDIIRYV